MTIQGAIDSALNGITAFSNQVGAISENLANTSTIGFKRVDSNFHDLVNGGQFGESSPNSVLGYYSPVSVRMQPIYRANVTGSITASDNPTSFAVSGGSGFVPVTETKLSNGVETLGSDVRYTRAADFSVDANYYLVNSQGQALMAIQETSKFSNSFAASPSASALVPVNRDPAIYGTLPGVASTSISVNANFPASATTQDFPPWSIPNPASPGTPLTGGTGAVAGVASGDQVLGVQFFDTQGTAHTLNLTLRKIYAAGDANPSNVNNTNSWAVVGMTVANDAAASGGVVDLMPQNLGTTSPPFPIVSFDSNGRLTGSTQIKVAISSASVDQNGQSLTDILPNGTKVSAGTSALSIDFGTPAMNSTQFAGVATEIRGIQDWNGHAPGNFSSASIEANGDVAFKYTNGMTMTPYRIPLATFPNPDLLERITGSTFGAQPSLAGNASWDWPGGNGGNIAPSAQESSNVDVASELTKMITAQRAYSSNSKVISTGDEMMQTAIGMKG